MCVIYFAMLHDSSSLGTHHALSRLLAIRLCFITSIVNLYDQRSYLIFKFPPSPAHYQIKSRAVLSQLHG